MVMPRQNMKHSKSREREFHRNLSAAQARWGELPRAARQVLRTLTEDYSLMVAAGDLMFLNSAWYITHRGLLGIARRNHCCGISTNLQQKASEPSARRWVFRAAVYSSPRCRGFTGYGDADPSNVSPLVRGAEMRVAETRAVNRALRKAYGIGLCSVEELGWEPRSYGPPEPQKPSSVPNDNGHQNGHVRLRDRLCLLIRQHQLDANLVKAYAADFCGTPNLRDASREQIESFISNLSDWASRDRSALLCKLNSYSISREVTS
jgi:hypothetical protein